LERGASQLGNLAERLLPAPPSPHHGPKHARDGAAVEQNPHLRPRLELVVPKLPEAVQWRLEEDLGYGPSRLDQNRGVRADLGAFRHLTL
jgi:hypothetical protein